MATFESAFSIGERAYYVVFATATIYAVQITNIKFKNNTMLYRLSRVDTGAILADVPEASVLTFEEAKLSLRTYLLAKLVEIEDLVAP